MLIRCISCTALPCCHRCRTVSRYVEHVRAISQSRRYRLNSPRRVRQGQFNRLNPHLYLLSLKGSRYNSASTVEHSPAPTPRGLKARRDDKLYTSIEKPQLTYQKKQNLLLLCRAQQCYGALRPHKAESICSETESNRDNCNDRNPNATIDSPPYSENE